jgi:hypothetical protein
MQAVASIAPGVRLMPVETPGGLRYRVLRDGRPGSLLPTQACAALLLMDGHRSLAEVNVALADLGAAPPEPARLIDMVRLLEAAGLLEVQHHYDARVGLAHACKACGQSCEGGLIVPVDDEEAEQLEQRLAALRDQDTMVSTGPAWCCAG